MNTKFGLCVVCEIRIVLLLVKNLTMYSISSTMKSMIQEVQLTKIAEKNLKKVPDFILRKFMFWVDSVMEIGLEETRKFKGFHDEPLSGKRKGQRSIRLSRAYRAIYEVRSSKIKFVQVLEVNKHEY
jgi:toxin HigB-1